MTSPDTNDDVYADVMREILSAEPCRGVVTEPTHLFGHVFIGSQSNAEDLRTLRRIGVTHVLNCAGYKGPRPWPDASPYEGLGIDYYEFKAEDSDRYDITRHFPEAFGFLDTAKRRRGVVLVHCALGINRSAAVCVGYAMVDSQMSLFAATRLIKDKRRVVLANKTFQRQLIRFARSRGLLDRIESLPAPSNEDGRATVTGSSSSRTTFTCGSRAAGYGIDFRSHAALQSGRSNGRSLSDDVVGDAVTWAVAAGSAGRILPTTMSSNIGDVVSRRYYGNGTTTTRHLAVRNGSGGFDDVNDAGRLNGRRGATGYYDTIVVDRGRPDDVTMTSSSRRKSPAPPKSMTSLPQNGATSVLDALLSRNGMTTKMADRDQDRRLPSSTGSWHCRSSGSAVSLPRYLGDTTAGDKTSKAAAGSHHIRSKSTSGVRDVDRSAASSRSFPAVCL